MNQLILFREITTLYSETGTKFISTFCSRISGVFFFRYYQHGYIKNNEMPQAYIQHVRRYVYRSSGSEKLGLNIKKNRFERIYQCDMSSSG
jgi:hypothetical protein